MRYLSGRAIALTHEFLNDETTVSSASASVTVTDAEGTAVVTDLAATRTAYSAGPPVVKEHYDVTLGMLPIGKYTIVWTAKDATVPTPVTVAVDTEEFEVVGNFLFTIAEARDSDSEIAVAANYPATEIAHYREVIESEFENITGRSFTTRAKRFTFTVDESDVESDTRWIGVHDAQALVSLSATLSGVDTAQTVADYPLDESGLLSGLSALPAGTKVHGVVRYGFKAAPEDLKRAGLIRLRHLLASENSGIPDRATHYVAAEGGQYHLATPGRAGYHTGVPDVDAVLDEYAFNVITDVMGAT